MASANCPRVAWQGTLSSSSGSGGPSGAAKGWVRSLKVSAGALVGVRLRPLSVKALWGATTKSLLLCLKKLKHRHQRPSTPVAGTLGPRTEGAGPHAWGKVGFSEPQERMMRRSYNYGVAEAEVDLGGIVGAVAARARAMTPECDPGGFLQGLSAQLQGLRMLPAMRRAPMAATPSLWLEPTGIPSPKPSHPVSLRGRPSSSETHRAMPAAWRGPPSPASHRRGCAQGWRCRSWASGGSLGASS